MLFMNLATIYIEARGYETRIKQNDRPLEEIKFPSHFNPDKLLDEAW